MLPTPSNTPSHTTTASIDPSTALERIVQFFETLSPQSLPQIAQIYTSNAHFKDPFNEVQGLSAIEAIFAHMFATLEAPRFVIQDSVQQGAQCFLTWDFEFRFKKTQPEKTQTIHGASHLLLDAQGRIHLHRDYWDAAEELYEKLPLLGTAMRWLKRRVATPGS